MINWWLSDAVCLTFLIDSTISFFTAFGLEALLYSDELWTRVPVGTLLATMIILIFWCVRTALEARADFSLLGKAHALKGGIVSFARRLRGKTPEPGPDTGSAGGGSDRGKIWMLSRSETLKEAFNRLRRPRRRRNSIVPVALDPAGSNRYAPQGATVVEMGEANDNAPAGPV